MGDFADKFKSFIDRAQQKVTELQNNEELKELKFMVGQVQEKILEYSELAQTELEEQYVAREKQKEEQRIAREKQKFEVAAVHASKRKYQKAVSFLNAILHPPKHTKRLSKKSQNI